MRKFRSGEAASTYVGRPCGRDSGRAAESGGMGKHFATILRVKARRRTEDRTRCSSCHRHPLAGELLHELESHRLVCQLCLVELPESNRATIASARVQVSERPLAVVSRAA